MDIYLVVEVREVSQIVNLLVVTQKFFSYVVSWSAREKERVK